MMKVTALNYKAIVGGPLNGALAIHLTIGGLEGTEYTGPALLELIVNFPKGAAKILYIDGSISGADDTVMFGLLKSLRDWEYHIVVESAGAVFPSWFALCHWNIVVIDTEPWLLYECQEIRLYFTKGTPEPALPEKKAQAYYLLPKKDVPGGELFSFVKNSKYPWGIIFPTSRMIMEPVGEISKQDKV